MSSGLVLKNILFTLLVPSSLAVYVPLLLVRGRAMAPAPAALAGAGLLLAGGAVYLWCVWDFAAFGRGTPAVIDPPRKLVVRGLYRFSRNPMYVGIVTAIAGWSVLFRSWLLAGYALAVWICLHLFVVLHEERALGRRFGADYERYRAQVGRWLTRPPRRAGGA